MQELYRMQMHLVDIFTYLLAIPVSMCSSHTLSLENATSYTELSAFSTREAILFTISYSFDFHNVTHC